MYTLQCELHAHCTYIMPCACTAALLESIMPAEAATAADADDADEEDGEGGEEADAAVAERAHTALCGTLIGSLRQLGFAPAHAVLALLWERAAPAAAAAGSARTRWARSRRCGARARPPQ